MPGVSRARSKQKGGLRLDSRAATLSGGNSGPAVVPGDAQASLLVEAVNYGENVQDAAEIEVAGTQKSPS